MTEGGGEGRTSSSPGPFGTIRTVVGKMAAGNRLFQFS